MKQELYLSQDINNLQRAENEMMELRDEMHNQLNLVRNGTLGFILDKWSSQLPDSNDQKPSTSQINVELFNDKIRSEPTMMNALRAGCAVLFYTCNVCERYSLFNFKEKIFINQ